MPYEVKLPVSEDYYEAPLEPEQLLALGVLAQALNDLARRHHRAQALAWIHYDKPKFTDQFTFVQCCEYLNIDPYIVRQQILIQKPKFIRYRTRRTDACIKASKVNKD